MCYATLGKTKHGPARLPEITVPCSPSPQQRSHVISGLQLCKGRPLSFPDACPRCTTYERAREPRSSPSPYEMNDHGSMIRGAPKPVSARTQKKKSSNSGAAAPARTRVSPRTNASRPVPRRRLPRLCVHPMRWCRLPIVPAWFAALNCANFLRKRRTWRELASCDLPPPAPGSRPGSSDAGMLRPAA